MYGKIFECIYEGTLYGQWEAIVTFQQMIVLCDDEGFLDMTPPALAAKTSIPLEIIQKGIEILERDDPYSRTPGENGKRIIRISGNRPWGWKIVNHEKYRKMVSNEDRKKYMRDYMREYRKNKGDPVNNESLQELTHVNETLKLTMLTHTDTDTNKDILSSKKLDYPYQKIISYLNNKTNKNFRYTSKETQRLIRARINQGFTFADFQAVIDKKSEKWLTDPKMMDYLRPQTLFGTKFESYLNECEAQKTTKTLTGREALEWDGS